MSIKRIFTIIYALVLTFSTVFFCSGNVFAADTAAGAESEEEERDMAGMEGEIGEEGEGYWPEGLEITAPSAIIMEYTTGTVLFEKNAIDAHYPASITKIMTGLLTVENGGLQDTLVFSEDAIRKTEGSGIARDIGEEMTVEQTLYGMMLASSNECAYALAEHISGTIEDFADKMNERAKDIGCVNTHFMNPHGLHDDDHYTCAYDMALISREAFSNDEFRKVVGTKKYTIPFTNKHKDEETFLQNHHEMLYPLKTNKYLYADCVGGKTGYTSVANSTLVTFATRDGVTLICVMMDSESAAANYKDTTNLFEYCFDNFQLLNISENEEPIESNKDVGTLSEDMQFFGIEEEGNLIIPKTASFGDVKREVEYSKDPNSDIIATLIYTYGDRQVGSAGVIKHEIVGDEFNFTTFEALMNEQEQVVKVDVKKVLVIVGIVIAAVCATVVMVINIPKLFYKIRRDRSQHKKGPTCHKIENSLERRRGRSVRRHEKKIKRSGPKIYR